MLRLALPAGLLIAVVLLSPVSCTGSLSDSGIFEGDDQEEEADGDGEAGGDGEIDVLPPDGDPIDGDRKEVDDDGEPIGDDETVGELCPDVFLRTTQLDVKLSRDEPTADRTVTVRNTGARGSVLSFKAEIIGGVGVVAFREYAPGMPIKLKVNESASIPLTFSHQKLTTCSSSTLAILSNSCLNPVKTIAIDVNNADLPNVDVSPDAWNFSEVALGAPAVSRRFRLCNHCRPEMQVIDAVFGAGTDPDFFLRGGDLGSGLSIPEGACHEFDIFFSPQTVGEREGRIVFQLGPRLVSTETITVELTGKGIESPLSIAPDPVDFSADGCVILDSSHCELATDCPEGWTCRSGVCHHIQDLSLYNLTNEAYIVIGAELKGQAYGDDCPEVMVDESFNADEGTGNLFPFTLDPGLENSRVIRLLFQPESAGMTHCSLQLKTDRYPPAPYLSFPVQAEACEPNICPTARVSLQSHGQPISYPISGRHIGDEICFYGNISMDPDGATLDMEWEISLHPDGSLAELRYPDENHYIACLEFDAYGDYEIALKVMDEDECWSEPVIVEVEVLGDQGLDIHLRFEPGDGGEGENLVDMDLTLSDSMGGMCSDDNLTSIRTCTFPQGHGVVLMPFSSNGVDDGGIFEAMQLHNPVDGPWTVGIRYVNDCMSMVQEEDERVCQDHLTPNAYTLTFYDPDAAEPTPLFGPYTGQVDYGDTVQYLIVRVDGIWQEPMPYEKRGNEPWE